MSSLTTLFFTAQPIHLIAIRSAFHAAIVLAVAIAATWLLRRTSAALRFSLLLTAQVVALVIPLATLILPAIPLLPTTITENSPQSAKASALTSSTSSKSQDKLAAHGIVSDRAAVTEVSSPRLSDRSSTEQSPVDEVNGPVSLARQSVTDTAVPQPSKFQLTMVFFAIWCVGSCLFAARLGMSMVSLQVYTYGAYVPVSSTLANTFETVQREMSASWPCRLVASEKATMPMAWGVFRPVVVVPSHVTQGDEKTLRSVLRHELAHVRRRDPLARLIGQWCTVFYWFNPFAWLAARKSAILAEYASDNLVLQQGGDAADYADHLLSVVRRAYSVPKHDLAPSMSAPSQLRLRIAAALDTQIDRRTPRRWQVIGIIAIGLLFCTPITAVSQKASGLVPATESEVLNKDKRNTDVPPSGTSRIHSLEASAFPDSSHVDWKSQRVAGVRYVRGRVLDADHQPVPNVHVGVHWKAFRGDLSPDALAVTDSLGQFELPLQRSSIVIAMDKARRHGGLTVVRNPDAVGKDGASPQLGLQETPSEIDITLEPLGDIRGSYWTNEASRRPKRVWTSVQKMPEEMDVIEEMDNSPFFAFRLPPGQYRLRGNAAHFEDVYREFVVEPTSAPVEFLDLPLPVGKLALLYGQQSPELHITGGLGIDTKFKLSEHRGKWVVLNFWGVWCGPCLFEMPQLFRFAEKHAADRDRFEIITVHHDSPNQKASLTDALPELVKRWQSTKDLKGDAFPFPIVIDESNQSIEAFGANAFPTMVFIDPQGHVANVPGIWGLSEILKGRGDKPAELFQGTEPESDQQPPEIQPAGKLGRILGKRCVAFNGHTDMVGAVSFLSDGTHFVTAGSDNTLRFWDANTREQTRLIRCTPQGKSMSSYGGIQLYVAQRANLIGGNFYELKHDNVVHSPRLWRADTEYQESISISDPGFWLGKADVSPDGERFAAYAFSQDSQVEVVRIYKLPEGRQFLEFDVHGDRRKDSTWGSAIKFSPDGRYLAVVGAKGHSIQVWNIDEARMLWEKYPANIYAINSISFAPDSQSFAYASWYEPVEFRDTTTGNLLRTLREANHRPVYVVISPSGRHMATTGNNPNPRVNIWDLGTGAVIGTLTGHATGARAEGVAWSPDNRHLVTITGTQTNQPGEVLLWDLVKNGIIPSR